MTFVTCPACGEKGRIPKNLVGHRVKCQKCGSSFFVGASAPGEPAGAGAGTAPAAGGPAVDRGDTIAVDGLDDAAWSSWPSVAHAVAVHEPDHEHDHGPDAAAVAFTASPNEPGHDRGPGLRRYKVLTSKDRFFEGKFDIARLEEALNHYARQGWVVRSMATPHVAAFGGGPKEELVILLER